MQWKPWTLLSENVPFKSAQKGVGNGEAKVAAELGATIMGQNKSFDLLLTQEGGNREIEVKELDKGTFNTGQKGRQALVRIRDKISSLFEIITFVENQQILEKNHKLSTFNPDEMSVGTLDQFAFRCAELNKLFVSAVESAPALPPFVHPATGVPFEMDVLKWADVYRAVGCPLNADMKLIAALRHPYIEDPNMLSTDLKSLVKLFETTEMIIVHKDKGYAAVDTTKSIVFERITRGAPRFRILEA